MADWSVLRSSGKDFLSTLSAYNHESNLSQYQMMSSFIDHSYSPSSLYDENSFCTPDNIEQCIAHLNQELAGMGLKPLSRDGLSRTTSLINMLNEIMRLYQRSGRVKEELETRLHRVTSDMTDNQSTICRLKSARERLEKEVAQEKEKQRQTHVKNKNVAIKLKAEKDELKRLQAVIKDRDVQYKHELRKKQRETNKLMERLHQLLVDKNPDRRIGMDMAGILQRGDGKRSTWNHKGNSSKQEEMYQMLVSNYEDKQQELKVENNDLRDCLLDMQKELSSVLNSVDNSPHTDKEHSRNGSLSRGSSETDVSSVSALMSDLPGDYFQMPYDMMRENLQKSFQETCSKIKENIRRCSTHTATNGKSGKPRSSQGKSPSSRLDDSRESERRGDDLEKLRNQIDKYKDIVKHQEDLIKQSINTQSRSMENSFQQESQILQERNSLSEQRRKLYQEKANFEEDRRKFTETAILLSHEKKNLEVERTDLLKSQFLQMSPFNSKPPTPPRSSGSLRGEKTRLLPSTPMFSPAPGKVKTPSTAELYRVLGLDKTSKMDQITSPSISIPKSQSTDSLSGSIKSAPCDLQQHLSGTSKRLSFENMDEIEQSLFPYRRCSSTGSPSSLDRQ